MDQQLSHVSIEDIEEVLGQVAEIKAARVVASPEGHIQEIHVLALPTKTPKQLVRDIESTIMASFGIPVDHRKISIAQLGSEVAPAVEGVATEALARPKIHSINASVSGVEAKATVTIELDGELHVGDASGSASQTGRRRIVAEATIGAIERFTQGAQSLALEDVTVIRLGREDVAVSCLTLMSPIGEQAFVGCALVRQNENDSIVRATLDAINRRMGLLKTT